VRILDRTEDNLDQSSDHDDTSMTKYFTIVDRVYKNTSVIGAELGTNETYGFKLEKNLNLYLWLNNNEIACKCPNIELNKRYLIMLKSNAWLTSLEYMRTQANYDEYASEVHQANEKSPNLIIDTFAYINEWKLDFIKRLRRFTRGSSRGKCSQ
jgi:hypothetical protein